tara:strand:+ start:2406 stop:2738 length:333 start_codon:yes stop_codon:yes gene_type:complete
MIAAGELRHRVTIVQPAETTSDVGQAEYDYTGVGTSTVVWGRVEYTSQNKTTEGEVQNAGQATFLVRMRYRTDVTYRSKLVYDSKILMVTGISQDVLKIETLVECEESNL